MSQTERDGTADDNALTTYRPSKDRWLQLPTVLAGMFPSAQTSIEFLVRDMGIPSARIPEFSFDKTPVEYWRRILNLFDAGDLIDAPYHQLFLAVQRRKVFDEPFQEIFGDFPRADPQAERLITPRAKGCHVIVRTRDERVRDRIRRWLESEELEPVLIWSVHEMTSFEVIEADAEQVRALINGRYARLLIKIIPPEQTDELIDGVLRVFDTDGRELPVSYVPIQLTVAELGAVAARFHPAEASTFNRTVVGRRRAESATHVGDGLTQQVPLDSTLLQCGISDNHKVTIKSVQYQEIRVVFVGASPRWNGSGRLGELRVSKELDRIRLKARPHIHLAEAFLNTTDEHLAAIMQQKPDILHIACHCQDGRLYWEDDDGDACEMPAGWLADCIADRAGRRLSGIVLSACDGESTGPIFTEAARKVIAHKGQLADNLAIKFTTKFYDELAQMPVLSTAARRADPSVLIFPPDAQGGL